MDRCLRFNVPEGIQFSFHGKWLRIKGKSGINFIQIPSNMEFFLVQNLVILTYTSSKFLKKDLNTFKKNFNNALSGAFYGFSKKLILNGLGFKSEMNESILGLKLGYSHLTNLSVPKGLNISSLSKKIRENTLIVEGACLDNVSTFAAKVRSKKLPDNYKGKGILYKNEKLIIKDGKKN